MGFPVGYLELPKLLLHIIIFLGYIRRIISWAVQFIGLLDPDAPRPSDLLHPPPDLHSFFLPALHFQDLLPTSPAADLPENCAVCLYDFEGREEVRRLSNCRHIFHRCCLDRWMDHEQRTCPLCRSPLFPEGISCAADEID